MTPEAQVSSDIKSKGLPVLAAPDPMAGYEHIMANMNKIP
jgi:hypothetical protein